MSVRDFLAGLGLVFLMGMPAATADAPILFLVQDSQPKYFLGNQENAGLCGDIYLALAKELALRGIEIAVSGQYLPIKRILALVEHGEAGGYCGAGRNKDRESRFVYSTAPIYSVSNVLAAHSSDHTNPSSFKDLAEMRAVVGAFYGTSSAKHLKEQPDIQVDDQFSSLDVALKTLAQQRHIRYFFYHDLGLYYLVKTSGLPLRVVPTKFRTVPQWMIFSPKLPEETLAVLDDEVSHLVKSGAIERIWAKYKP